MALREGVHDMRVIRRRGLVRQWGVVFAIASSALVLQAQPVAAVSCGAPKHDIVLSSGAASPGSGSTATSFSFSVVYRDNAGCAPSSIAVTVSGAGTFALAAASTNFQAGAPFRKTLKLSAGSHTYRFSATSGTGKGLRTVNLTAVSPSVVAVAAPKPSPTAKPAPTPPPQPPTPKPTPRPPSAKPTKAQAHSPSPAPGSPSGSSPSAGSPSPSGDPLTAGVFPGLDSLGGGGLSGPDSRLSPPSGTVVALGTLLTVLFFGGIGLVLARRRDRGLEEVAGEAAGASAQPSLATSLAGATTGSIAATLPGVPLEEMGMPRWRRPSLREARQASPRGGVVEPHKPILFREDPPPDIERRFVRYRIVRVTDAPDEILGAEVGHLGEGDEVEVVERKGMYLRVRTPTGIDGWVHRTTLDEVH